MKIPWIITMIEYMYISDLFTINITIFKDQVLSFKLPLSAVMYTKSKVPLYLLPAFL